ncbi:MAG: hypothetical protein ACH349_01410 [Candidatus Rhabdochlamydia sp.]
MSTPKGISQEELKNFQEIKNHKDWMYDIGQQIQSLSQHLVSLSLQHEKVLAQSQSDKKALLISFENLQEKVTNQIDNFFQRIGDIESRCGKMQVEFGDKLFDYFQNFLTKDEHSNSIAFQCKKFNELEEKLKKKNDFLSTELVRMNSCFTNQITSLQKEIPSIEEFKPLKQEMEEKFQTFKVDFSGLVKELALLKKSVNYDQKKFENIYTLIGRLKEGKQ